MTAAGTREMSYFECVKQSLVSFAEILPTPRQAPEQVPVGCGLCSAQFAGSQNMPKREPNTRCGNPSALLACQRPVVSFMTLVPDLMGVERLNFSWQVQNHIVLRCSLPEARVVGTLGAGHEFGFQTSG